jgi:hypothetical protein
MAPYAVVVVVVVVKATTITIYATLFMYCLLLEKAPLLRHVSAQQQDAEQSYENYQCRCCCYPS